MASAIRGWRTPPLPVATPQGTFGGALLHEGPIEQAAAYLFHLCGNHPFLDGNKRVALATALVFLYLHGIESTIGTTSCSSL